MGRTLLEQESPQRRIFRWAVCNTCVTAASHRVPKSVHMALDTVSRIHLARPRERDYHVIPQAERQAPIIKLDSRVEGQRMNIARLFGEVVREPVHTLCVLIGVGVHGMPLGHHLACDGASESSVAAAVGGSVRGDHYAPKYTGRMQAVQIESKKFRVT